MPKNTTEVLTIKRSFLAIFVLASSISAHGKVLYEGWHKVLSAGQHVGYFVVRYDLEEKTNKFKYTSFLKTNSVGNDVTEAIEAESLQVTTPAQWIVPQKYKYTMTQGKEITLIDAQFAIQDAGKPEKKEKKGKKSAKKEPEASAASAKPQLRMIATITKGGNATKYDQIVPDSTFLSSYLTYIILQSKDGLKVGNNYKYSAIAEEDGKLYDGVAFVKEMTKDGGVDGYKIVNEFKGIRFISVVNTKGDPISTKSPLLSIATEAAASSAEAVGKLKLDDGPIRTLFGEIPSAGVKK